MDQFHTTGEWLLSSHFTLFSLINRINCILFFSIKWWLLIDNSIISHYINIFLNSKNLYMRNLVYWEGVRIVLLWHKLFINWIYQIGNLYCSFSKNEKFIMFDKMQSFWVLEPSHKSKWEECSRFKLEIILYEIVLYIRYDIF